MRLRTEFIKLSCVVGLFNDVLWIKGVVHPKMKTMFIYLYVFISFLRRKKRCRLPCNESEWDLRLLPDISFYASQNKESHAGLKQHVGE